jgi:hypothetical protein
LRIYNLLKDIAARRAPAPTISEFETACGMSRAAIMRAIQDLCMRGLLIEQYARPHSSRRRFRLPETGTATTYSRDARSARTHNRLCITGCGRSFASEGPHHRMCHVCRHASTMPLGTAGAIATLRRGV